MKDGFVRRGIVVLLFLCAVLGVAAGVWRSGTRQALDQLSLQAYSDLALASDRLVGQLQRYRDLAVLMASHPQIAEALRRAPSEADVALLQEVADKSAALDVLVLDVTGRVRLAAMTSPGVSLRAQPHVVRALQGALGWGHGPNLPLTARAFFHAAPIFGGDGKVGGALLVVTDLNGIDYSWRGANPAVFFTDAQGIVQISNRSELIFWRRPQGQPGLMPPKAPPLPFGTQKIGPHELWQLGWGPYLPSEALHLTRAVPVVGLTGEVLLDVAPSRAVAANQAATVAAMCLAFGALLFLATERRRTLARTNAELETRVAARTAALREMNDDLRHEAEVREAAQTALRRAQDDLVQAGKLSALGQMSAGISHELNQPLMAIQSFAENGVQFMERGNPKRAAENLGRISEMTQRMGRIIRNLRAFARQENGPHEAVELGKVLMSALELTQSHMQAAGVSLVYEPSERPIWVRGGEVRLGQVFVNLITNAVDAMIQSPKKQLRVLVAQGDSLSVSIHDTGPGIEMPDKVFDPFYTTKSVGDYGGMGLGL